MKKQKKQILLLSLIALSIIVFNNITQVMEKLFFPYDGSMVMSFLVILLSVIIYHQHNK